MSYIDVVFTGPPAAESGRFIEVEDAEGRSINVGEWIQRPDGTRALRIGAAPVSDAASPQPQMTEKQRNALQAACVWVAADTIAGKTIREWLDRESSSAVATTPAPATADARDMLLEETTQVLDMLMCAFRAKGWEGDAVYIRAEALLDSIRADLIKPE